MRSRFPEFWMLAIIAAASAFFIALILATEEVPR